MIGRLVRALERLSSGSLASSGGLLFLLAVTAVNASGFLYHVFASRVLTPSDYGAIGALLGLLLVLSVPASAIQVAITKEVASTRSAILASGVVVPVCVGPLLTSALLYGGVGFLLLLTLSPMIADYLHLPSTRTAVFVAAYVVPAAIGLVPRAVLLGELRFRRVAAGLAAGAVSRLLLVATVGPRAGLDAAMAANVVGEIVTAAVLLPAMRHLVGDQAKHPLRMEWRDAFAGAAAFTGFYFFTAIDTIVARRSLPGAESGLYSAAAVAARAAMFLPAAVSLIAFPRFAEHRGVGSTARQALVQALGVVLLLDAAVFVVILLAPGLVVSILFGSEYAGAVPTLRVLVIASGLAGLMNVLMHFHLAGRRTVAASVGWLATAGVAGAGTVFTLGSSGIAIVTVIAGMAAVATMLAVALSSGKTTQTLTSRDEDLWRLPAPEVDFTVIVPYFNPGGNTVAKHVTRLISVLEQSGGSFEIITVSDGSTDDSAAAVQALAHPSTRQVLLEANAGKGQALRVGLAMARGRYLGFIDADGDIDAATFTSFVGLANMYEPDIVLGSKRHPLSNVEYPVVRRIYSWGYQQLIRALFRLNIRDSQTGIKLMKREVVAAVLPRMVEKRFAFDLELFVVARYLGFTRFFEAPVTIRHQFRSTVSLRSVYGMILDTLGIFYRLRVTRYYDDPARDSVANETSVLPIASHERP